MIWLTRLRQRSNKRRRLETILRKANIWVLAGKMYLNPSLRCSQVAKAIGTNRTYLWEALGRHGLGFQEYLSKFRILHFIEHAREYTDLKGAEIAELCGFNDAKSLNRYLKQTLGVSLSYYMKSLSNALSEEGKVKTKT